MKTLKIKDHPALQRVLRDLTRKQKAFVHSTERVSLSGTYWSGGSRSEYYLVDYSTGGLKPLAVSAPAQFGGPVETPVYQIQPGQMVVCVGTFQGNPATPTVYLRPDADLLKELGV